MCADIHYGQEHQSSTHGPTEVQDQSLHRIYTLIEGSLGPKRRRYQTLQLSISRRSIGREHFRLKKARSHSAGLGPLRFVHQLKLVRHSGELA